MMFRRLAARLDPTLTALRRRYGRPLFLGLSLLGLAVLAYFAWIALQPTSPPFGFDAAAYYQPKIGPNLYSGTKTLNGIGAWRYAPIWAYPLVPTGVIPFPVFAVLWSLLEFLCLWWMLGRWTFVALVFVPIPAEIYEGNIHLLMAAAIVLSFRWPGAWSFLLLTKVTPGIGVLWFALRREWRPFLIAAAATFALIALGLLLDASLWASWIHSLLTTGPSIGPNHVPIPLAIRLPLAAAILVWAALTNRRWAVPIAALVALPTIWTHSLSMFAAVPALLIRARR